MKYLGFVIVLIGALLVSSCAEWFPHSYRFKMIVEVETPQGLVMGSSVYEVGATKHTQILADANSRSRWVKGEALSVELPNGQILFATLKTGAHLGDLATLSMATLYPKYSTETFDYVDVAKKIDDRDDDVLERAVVPLKRIKESYHRGEKIREYVSNYPFMVIFEDIDDPATIMEADPSNLPNGARVKRIIIELTDDYVTTGIDKKLKWLDTHKGSLVRVTKDRDMTNMFPAQLMGVHDFRRGTNQ